MNERNLFKEFVNNDPGLAGIIDAIQQGVTVEFFQDSYSGKYHH